MKYYLLENKKDEDSLIRLMKGVIIKGVFYNRTVRAWLKSLNNSEYVTEQKILKMPEDFTNLNIGNVNWMPLHKCKELKEYRHWIDKAIKP